MSDTTFVLLFWYRVGYIIGFMQGGRKSAANRANQLVARAVAKRTKKAMDNLTNAICVDC